MKKTRAVATGLTPLILLAGIIAAGAWYARKSIREQQLAALRSERLNVATTAVTQNEFILSAEASGKLASVQSKVVMAEVDGQVLRIVPNGIKVKKGDTILELDSPRMVREMRSQQMQYNSALAQMSRKKRDLAADVERSQIALSQAERDQERYLAGQQSELAEKEVQKAFDEESMQRKKVRFERRARLIEQKLVPSQETEVMQAEVKADEFRILTQAKDLELTTTQKAAERGERKASLDRARDDQERAKSTQEFENRSALTSLKINEQQLGRVKEQLDKAIIRAPADGILVLGTQYQSRGVQRPLQAGDMLYPQQQVATIPDLTKMRVMIDLPQDQARRVRRKQKVRITVEAIPGVMFDGEVVEISSAARELRSASFGIPTGERAFPAMVDIKDTKGKAVRPGMSAHVSIIIERIPKALTIPLECVFDRNGKDIVYVRRKGDFIAVPVELGPRNDDMVVVKKGLKRTDRVALRDTSERARESNNGAAKTSRTADLPM